MTKILNKRSQFLLTKCNVSLDDRPINTTGQSKMERSPNPRLLNPLPKNIQSRSRSSNIDDELSTNCAMESITTEIRRATTSHAHRRGETSSYGHCTRTVGAKFRECACDFYLSMDLMRTKSI